MEILKAGSFCIENTYSSKKDDASTTISPIYSKESILSARKSSKWIVKACQEKRICDSVPCIRKCCQDGERLVLENDEKRCDPHPHGYIPNFHFFQFNEFSQQIDYKQADPPGMF